MAVAYFAIDLVAVLLFAIAERTTRGLVEGVDEAWPFFVGVLIGWLVARGWRSPRAVIWTGVIVWASTMTVGLVVRLIIGQSTDSRAGFITLLALGVFLLGWRAIAWILDALFGRALPKVVDEKYRR
ncbi:MAG: rane protein [Microbacteriaceae bacterium]|nr:rane protein [Microbacteriaceae bacterium]